MTRILFLAILIGVGLLASSLPSGATATMLDTASLGTPDVSTPVAPGQPQDNDDDEKIGEGVREALSTDGEADVVIALTEPPSLETQPVDVEKLREEVAELQQDVLSAIEDSGNGHSGNGDEDFTLRYQYSVIPALAGTIETEQGLSTLAAHQNVRGVGLDIPVTDFLDASVPLIGADAFHTRGITGQGVTVAVLDTGLDTNHDDLSDDLIHEECFVLVLGGGCPNGTDRQSGPGAAEDGQGHGTHVTGIITSRGTISSVGVAPDADIVAIKVLHDNRTGTYFDILAGLDFILNNRPDVDVINMSLGGGFFPGNCDTDPGPNMAMASTVNALRGNGVITFAASGNDNSGTQLGSPACISNIVSVGATDDADNVYEILPNGTNSNATLDIMAPGVAITSTFLANGVATLTGTSMASPHAAGCAALLIEAGVATTPDQIESRLETSGVQITDPKNNLTFPRIDCSPAKDDTPEERACTLDAQAGRVIVEFPEDVVLTTRKQSENSFGPLAVDIPSGTYHITLVSFDDHIQKPQEEDQTQESWFLQAKNEEGDTFFESNAISDLPEAQNTLEERVEEDVEITEDITWLSAKHVLGVGESDTAESIWPVCAAFDEVEENNNG